MTDNPTTDTHLRSRSLLKRSQDALEQADPNDPHSLQLRAATENAYLAMHHALAETAIESLRESGADGAHPLCVSLYALPRYLDFNLPRPEELAAAFSPAIVDFVKTIAKMRVNFDDAVRSPAGYSTVEQVTRDIAETKTAVNAFYGVHLAERVALLLYLPRTAEPFD